MSKTKTARLTGFSKGPWANEVTMSSDFRHIRRISNAEGVVVADIRYAGDAEQAENLANAELMRRAPEMFGILQEIEAMLENHPEAQEGNAKVHYCLCLARRAQAQKM